MSIRILLADDHTLFREGLQALLVQDKCFSVVGLARNGQEAIELAHTLMPDVLVIDMMMPVLSGVDAARRIVSFAPQIKILGLSMHTDRRLLQELFQIGARGYLLKDSAFDELAAAIRALVDGRFYFSPLVSNCLLEKTESKPAAHETEHRLTAREREILTEIARAYSNKEIAARLFLSVKTVETHRRNIMAKLNIDCVVELTKYAIRNGYVEA